MEFVPPDRVHALLPYGPLVEALREAHRGAPVMDDSLMMRDPSGENAFISLGAWRYQEAIAVKLVGVFPKNVLRTPPQPSIQGVVVLFDATTGAPVLSADGAAMTERKTAADSALAADFLARSDAETLLVVGAGALAPHVIEAHCSVRPGIKSIFIWNRTWERADALAKRLLGSGRHVHAASDLDTAVSEADIISCVTMSERPLIRGALLRPGAHVDLIGAYTPAMRESDDDTIRRARVFVDNPAGMEKPGDLAGPLAAGLIAPGSIRNLWELCRGEAQGRRAPDEITVFKNIGGAHLDLFTIACLRAALAAAGETAS
jgi:ornithine cyclodeaminase/alanine dehydrogenase-like protein (mu-crystallin family)